MEKNKNTFFTLTILLFIVLITALGCTMGGENPFSTKKQVNIQYPLENANIRDSFIMRGRILTDKVLESIEVRFTEIGVTNPKIFGPYLANIDQTEKKWEIELNTLVENAYPLPDGKYDVVVEALDAQQMSTRISTVYHIDNTKPFVVLTSPIAESFDSPWEFNSRMVFTGSVYDKSSATSLTFYFYNEENELLASHTIEVDTEQWVLRLDKDDEVYKTLIESGAEKIYFTLDAEDSAREYKAFDELFYSNENTSDGNFSEGFYLAQDFVAQQDKNLAISARTLYAFSSDAPLHFSEASYDFSKADLISKKRDVFEIDSQTLTCFTILQNEEAPFVQSSSLIPQQNAYTLLKNIVSTKESLFFEFHQAAQASILSKDISYTLKRKTGEEWVSVFSDGKVLDFSQDKAMQKIDIDESCLLNAAVLTYAYEAPQVLGDYKLEFFIQDIYGRAAQDAVWYFTVVEPNPSLFVDLKEINLDAKGQMNVLLTVNSITDNENTFLSIFRSEGFDQSLEDLKANEIKALNNGFFSLSWDIEVRNAFINKDYSYLIFEVKNAERKNLLFKSFTRDTKENLIVHKDKLVEQGLEKLPENLETSKDLQNIIDTVFENNDFFNEKTISIVRPSINLETKDATLHFDTKGEYYNFGYLNEKTIIPLVTENIESISIKETIHNNTENLDVSLVKIDDRLWNLIIEIPKTSMQGILEIVGTSIDGYQKSLRMKALFDKDPPFLKLNTLANNFYNKSKPFHLAGFCIDYSAQAFPQSGIEPVIEYALVKNFDESENWNNLSWEKVAVENPLDWDIYLEPELFEDDSLYSIAVRVKDKSGNYSAVLETSIVSFYVDSQDPLIVFAQDLSTAQDFTDIRFLNDKEFLVFNLEGFIEEKTFLTDGLAYWGYERQFTSESGETSFEIVDLIPYTLGNYWSIEDILEVKGEYRFVFTIKDLSGNQSSLDYIVQLQ